MIISASRRTDIPAYYSDWFINRLKERYVLVRNPMSYHSVGKVDLSPQVVDCIVFWTKNPAPMLGRLNELDGYNYYFQFTLTPYEKDIETNLPPKTVLLDSFKRLSDSIGRERVIWRYDPILINGKYSVEYHEEYFENFAGSIKDFTEKCTISFIDFYSKINKSLTQLGVKTLLDSEKRVIAAKLSKIALSYGLSMDACAEEIDLSDLSISRARCIDDRLISSITGRPITAEKDKNQRQACGCVSSIDIGQYDTCLNGCRYCYANHDIKTAINNNAQYDVNSPLLCSKIGVDDKITERQVSALKRNKQMSLFE